MADMRAIRARISSVENIGQITKSIKTASAARLRMTQERFRQTSAFSSKCREILDELIGSGAGTDNALIRPHSGGSRCCLVVFVGSRGLCGAYNTAVLKYLGELISQRGGDCAVVAVGRWGAESFAAAGIEPVKRFADVGDVPAPGEARELAKYLTELFLSGVADTVELVYQHYVSAISQTPASKTLLPLDTGAVEKRRSEYIFEPDRDTLIEKLVRLDVDNEVYSVLLEAKKGEHSARLNTMTAAVDNTDELLDELILEMNHARQSEITTELNEIMGSGRKDTEE